MKTLRSAPRLAAVAAAGAFLALAVPAPAQVQFSINYRGATIGVPVPPFGVPITEADILVPTSPGFLPGWGLAAPTIQVSGGFAPPGPGLGLPRHGFCLGHPPGVPCGVEVDALSHGTDYHLTPGWMPSGTFVFSVDPCSFGGAGVPLAPNVTSEAPVFDAAADVFQDLGLPPAPLPPGPAIGNVAIADGDGLPSARAYQYVEFGLVEPTFPGAGATGDDVDAIDFDSVLGPPWYFSLDATFWNTCWGAPNTGSAGFLGVPPGAVLATFVPGGPPIVWAPPGALGLDIAGGAGTDDLDALALWENGTGVFEPSMMPYDWLNPGGPDMLLFSVRRDSAVVGAPDSRFGAPIEPGDILTTPLAGGLSPFPAIFVAAEWLGLTTGRSGGPISDLDALDTRFPPQTGTAYCFGTAAACPCNNPGIAGHGCASTLVPAGGLLAGTGIASVAADTVTLNASSLPGNKLSLFFQGTTQLGGGFGLPLNDGLNCAGGAGSTRLGSMVATAAGTSFYPNPLLGHLPVSIKGAIPPAGATRHYTVWYRDPPSICGVTYIVNYTNGFSIVWTP